MKTTIRNKWLSLAATFAVALVVACLASCNMNREKPKPQATEFELGMTSQDSIAVKNLIGQFFTFVEAKDYAAATQMLFRTDPQHPGEEPQPLGNDEIKAVMQTLQAVPVEGYRIEYIKFSESYSNEVLCYVTIKKSTSKDMPDITTKMFFKPMRHLGQWCLGLTNSEWGDRGVVDPAKRDSVKREYAAGQHKEGMEKAG